MSRLRALDCALSVLVSAALIVLGVIVPVTVIQAMVDPDPADPVVSVAPVSRFLHRTEWGDARVVALGIGIALFGLLILIIELIPHRRRMLAMGGDEEGLVAAISPRTVAGELQRAARTVEGVSRAKAKIRGRRAVVRVETSRREPDELSRTLTAALADLELARPLRLRLRLPRSSGEAPLAARPAPVREGS